MSRGHLDRLTVRSDEQRVATCAPMFASIVASTIMTIDWMLSAKGRNGIVARIFETSRSPEVQLERWRRGRALTERGWEVVSPKDIVTNAQPSKAPHCIVDSNGKPAALAADIWLLDHLTGQLLPDTHPAWAMVPAAAFLAGGTLIKVGAHFSSPRDWPHIEWADWRTITTNGVLMEVPNA